MVRHENSLSINNLTNAGDVIGLIVMLVLIGVIDGPVIASIASFASPWYPVEERGRIVSVIFMGVNVSKWYNDLHFNGQSTKLSSAFANVFNFGSCYDFRRLVLLPHMLLELL